MSRKAFANHGPGLSLALSILVGVLASPHSGLAQGNPPQGCPEKPPAGVTTKPINGPNGPIGLRQGGVPSPDDAYATQLSNHFIQIPNQWR